jgi:hypothetical protein
MNALITISFEVFLFITLRFWKKVKGKAIPVRGHEGP